MPLICLDARANLKEGNILKMQRTGIAVSCSGERWVFHYFTHLENDGKQKSVCKSVFKNYNTLIINVVCGE